MLTQDALKERLTYDPETGVFRHRADFKRFRAGDVAGGLTTKGYWRIKLNDQEHKAHRLAWLYMRGTWPIKHLDHINQNRADNRIENLREADAAENGQNRKLGSNSTSGAMGVCFAKKTAKWQASIMVNSKPKYLGQFATCDQASAAYAQAKQTLHTFQPTTQPN